MGKVPETRKAIRIEIWSDVVCPFCYIGKRGLELALEQFPRRDQVELHWRSFELDPEGKKKPDGNAYERLAKKYGQTLDWAKQVTAQTSAMGNEFGVRIDYDRVIPANTFNAHRLIHLADRHGLQERMKERLMAAYFTEGRNINDIPTLVELGVAVGLDAQQVRTMLESDEFTDAVRADELAAYEIGVNAVPFFLINGEFSLTGAQPPDVFLAALQSVKIDGKQEQ